VQPRPLRVLFMALLIGLGVGFGLAFVTELLEDR
jgi:capsular polysaccharide biosynthesis protein